MAFEYNGYQLHDVGDLRRVIEDMDDRMNELLEENERLEEENEQLEEENEQLEEENEQLEEENRQLLEEENEQLEEENRQLLEEENEQLEEENEMNGIKFRAWHKEKRVLAKVLDWNLTERTVRLPIERYVNKSWTWSSTIYDLKDVELIQFTGLKDINGIDVFDKDIIEATNIQGVKVIGQVYWNYGCYEVQGYYFKNLNNFRVVGNVYENEYLLEGVNK